MEFWTITNKCMLVVYITLTTTLSQTAQSPWYVFFVLIYLCMNIAIYLVPSRSMRFIMLLLSVLLIIVFTYSMNPIFLLLLPMNMYEMISIYMKKYQVALLLLLIPLIYLPHDMILLYCFITVLQVSFLTMVNKYINRIATYRDDMELMHNRIHTLTRNLQENNEYLQQSEYTFKLEERNRVSQEIHDKVGHSMTGALIQMEASKRLLTNDPEKAAQLLQNAIHISKEGIESIRLVLKNIKPTTEQLGINRMKLFIDEHSAQHPIQTALTHDGNVDIITPIQWKIIMENTKEAFTNTMKYSQATMISIHLEVLSTLIKIRVSDNGIGTQKIIKGLGIMGMEERAATVNGTVIVDGSRGFSVTTLLPIVS